MKTITATNKGIAINYEKTGKSSFIPYQDEPVRQNNDNNRHYQMNSIQYKLYQQLMHGMKLYSSEERATMSENAVFSINNKHLRATEVLNMLKYERCYGHINKLFKVIFPQVKLDYFKDGKYADMPTLRELGITTLDIIDTWIENKLLPLNFYSLDTDNIKL
jgi:hypothetical protein